jgi:IclR family pca regulon transcriptional regulator
LIVVPASRFGISEKELELGMRAMAVPVIGGGNEIIAAISARPHPRRGPAQPFPSVLQSCDRMLGEAIRNSG